MVGYLALVLELDLVSTLSHTQMTCPWRCMPLSLQGSRPFGPPTRSPVIQRERYGIRAAVRASFERPLQADKRWRQRRVSFESHDEAVISCVYTCGWSGTLAGSRGSSGYGRRGDHFPVDGKDTRRPFLLLCWLSREGMLAPSPSAPKREGQDSVCLGEGHHVAG